MPYQIDPELLEAIEAFEQIEKHATHDTFLEVYDEQNNRRFTITRQQYNKVMGACKTHAFEGVPDQYKDEPYMKALEKEISFLKNELWKWKEFEKAFSVIKDVLK